MPVCLPGPHNSHHRLHVPGQGLAWELGHWGPFPSFSTDLLCDLRRSLPFSGPQCPEDPTAFLSHGEVCLPEI